MIKSSDLLNSEKVYLLQEMALCQPTDTPFSTLLMNTRRTVTLNSIMPVWREESLDSTDDITVPEGSATNTFQQSTRVELSNVCQIFKKGVQVSGTMQAVGVEGIADIYAHEVANRLTELKINMEKALINSVYDDGSTSGVRRMRGLLNWVLDTQKMTGALTEDSFNQFVKLLWDNGLGANNYILMCNADVKLKIDALYKDQVQYVNVSQDDDFGILVNNIITNFGNVKVVLNRHMPAGKMVLFDPSYLRLGFLRPPFTEKLAKDGDYISGHVIAEGTLIVLNRKAIALFEVA